MYINLSISVYTLYAIIHLQPYIFNSIFYFISGRPRGSTKANSIASVKQASKNVRTNLTPSTSAACMNELRQLRGILDVVASASKAVSSAAFVKKEM